MKVKILALAGIVMLLTFCQNSSDPQNQLTSVQEKRIISLSGFVTELLYDLDLGNQIVGVDVTSTYPDDVKSLPQLGHISQINAEGIMSLSPDLILVDAQQMAQNPVFEQLANSGVEILPVQTQFTLHNAYNVAEQLSEHIAIDHEKIKELKQQLDQDSVSLNDFKNQIEKPAKVLFIYARGAGNLMVAGKETSAAAIIKCAGGINAVEEFQGFRALTAESLLESNPDVVLMFESGLASFDNVEGLSQIPGMSQTAAFKNKKIIAMDGHYLTSFGPRVGKAALELSQKLY
ncbi:heme/hemin ABC transporter substrate-binding protein [Membranihabitans marinus]|uniref:heme/hemin ABC transporter substrate-binding protein n=1 Tax=Membranihabitans marinus TaxID=1227546 RepID=UPI001F194B79|nr:ABC transporter substrate-binding protein [Membranihabitans marinus]